MSKNNPSDHGAYFILIRIFHRPMNDKTEHTIANIKEHSQTYELKMTVLCICQNNKWHN